MDALSPRPLTAARLGVLVLFILATLTIASPAARASVADEQQAGQQLAQQVQSGERSCGSLSKDDLDHIGEFVMGRMIGSISAHEAMNARMTAALGSQAESRMHQVLGARFVRCSPAGAANSAGAAGSMMNGQGMMGSGSSSGSQGWGDGQWQSMMGSASWESMMASTQWRSMMGARGDWSWMTGSRWQHMSDADWQDLQRRMLGPAAVRTTSTGWHTRDIALLVLVVILAAGLTGALIAWHPWRSDP